MSVLLILSGIYYKERILFADSAFKLFDIIVNQRFSIDEHRYGSFVSQLLPLLARRLHLSVGFITIVYSLSFNIFFLAATALLVYPLRQYGLAILMSMYYFLFVSACFYWPNDELHQAVAWMFLMFGIITYMSNRQARFAAILVIWTALSALVVFTHFVALIPTFFLLVFFALEKNIWKISWKQSILLGVVLVVITASKLLSIAQHSYDANSMHGVTHVSFGDVFLSFTKPVVTDFLQRCISNYWVGVLCLCIGIVYAVKMKAAKQIAWVVASVSGYFILMGLAYGNLPKDYFLFYSETEWACISIIVAAVFVYHALPSIRPSVTVVLLAAIYTVRIGYIFASASQFTWRTHFKDQVFAQMKHKGISKVALLHTKPLADSLLFYWALPEETLLQSAIADDKPSLTFQLVLSEDSGRIDLLRTTTVFISAYGPLEREVVNKRYFSIDTTDYTIMDYPGL